ncbi:MAG: hypothetical protein KTR22_10440, partial [Flavobacteriaceae bacterium]|nr:hypothetical protein [Flavobacteriaceae bacterium]
MERKPMLTSNELIHLKLFVYGYSKDDFLKFYDLDPKMFPIYHLSIQNKFRTKNWRNIIRRAFGFNLLNKEDFVENSTKKTASDYADVIFEILTSPLKISQKRKEVHDQIIEFLACCNHKLAF